MSRKNIHLNCDILTFAGPEFNALIVYVLSGLKTFALVALNQIARKRSSSKKIYINQYFTALLSFRFKKFVAMFIFRRRAIAKIAATLQQYNVHVCTKKPHYV